MSLAERCKILFAPFQNSAILTAPLSREFRERDVNGLNKQPYVGLRGQNNNVINPVFRGMVRLKAS
jgi:hypothetical protein